MKTKMARRDRRHRRNAVLSVAVASVACSEGPDHGDALDPQSARSQEIDRFSDAAGTQVRRSTDPTLPGANEPVDFDARFYVRALGPLGGTVAYYALDVHTNRPMPVYRLVDSGGTPIAGQLTIVPDIPGGPEYNDFWEYSDVAVPSGYLANSITSVQELTAAGYPSERTSVGANRPIAPRGSVATHRVAPQEARTELAWYDDAVVEALVFDEHPLNVTGGTVHYADIYVCLSPDPSPQGPVPGTMVCADDEGQTHNTLTALPGQPAYSAFWHLLAYEEAAFDAVVDLETARAAAQVASVGFVNCPVAAVP